MSIISDMYHKVMPKEATKWTLSTGDFGINCILGALLLYLWPHPIMFLCSGFIWFATMGVSYRIPIFARDCARVGDGISFFVLWLAILCSIGLSTTGLNMVSKIAIDEAAKRSIDAATFASFDIGIVSIGGDLAITWVMFFFSIVMSVCNGLGNYINEKKIITMENSSRVDSLGNNITPFDKAV